jgi:hypothetical protein
MHTANARRAQPVDVDHQHLECAAVLDQPQRWLVRELADDVEQRVAVGEVDPGSEKLV